MLIFDIGTMVDQDTRDLNNSRVLDVHTWSDYPEVNDFVDDLYGE